jgi:hypothetical protein
MIASRLVSVRFGGCPHTRDGLIGLCNLVGGLLVPALPLNLERAGAAGFSTPKIKE